MKELNKKLGELNQRLGVVKNIINDLKNDIEELKEKKHSYFAEEIAFNEYKEEQRKLEKNIAILDEASKIILGI